MALRNILPKEALPTLKYQTMLTHPHHNKAVTLLPPNRAVINHKTNTHPKIKVVILHKRLMAAPPPRIVPTHTNKAERPTRLRIPHNPNTRTTAPVSLAQAKNPRTARKASALPFWAVLPGDSWLTR